jgi:hypothetical protein
VARKFFYVCAGLLCLVLTYQVGARNASAQAGGLIESPASFNYHPLTGYTVSFVTNRQLYTSVWLPNSQWQVPAQTAGGPIPGSSPVVALMAAGGPSGATVLLANGDLYRMGNSWEYQGNLLGGAPTPAVRESFGQLKARYR